jgi:uncharacterized membrane protein YphA (DoxX/SURF4 family)
MTTPSPSAAPVDPSSAPELIATSASPAAPEKGWSLAHRIAFRFACVYFLLYCLPFPLDAIPAIGSASERYEELWQAVVPWVGRHVLGVVITTFPNGSGDTTFNYVQVLCFLVLAVVATGLWSALDRRRAQYTAAHGTLRVYLRYVLAFVMLSYGFAKVFKLQFPYPAPDRLMQPLGEMSPMGLVWTFMGYSAGYNLFTGGAEVLGGLLLFFRRTTTLGALVVVGVMSNVVMLNFCYDVPVKLYSTHLVLLAGFLLLPDLRRLAHLLVLNRPTEPITLRTPFQRRWLERSSRWAKVLVIGAALFLNVKGSLDQRKEYGDSAPPPPLYGLYEVESFLRDGVPAAPLLTDATQWRQVAFKRFGAVTVRMVNGTAQRFRMMLNAENHTLSLTPVGEPGSPSGLTSTLNYSEADSEHLLIEGTLQGEAVPVSIRLRKVDTSQFLLVNRGFHWVNEYPFNR